MFLFQRIDFIALLGLFVQAFVAWVFVVVLASLRRGAPSSRAMRSYFGAFIALAIALTIVSVRFFRAHDVSVPDQAWADGRWMPRTAYIGYQVFKAAFGLLLVRGSFELAERSPSPWLRRVWWPVLIAMGAVPLLLPGIDDVLLVQAPMMIVCALLAFVVLPRPGAEGSGLRLVRWALLGLAGSWIVHGFAVLVQDQWALAKIALAYNSFIDLAVELALGTGCIISLMQDAHRKLEAAEKERQRLQREIDRDEKLRALGTLVSGVAHELNNPLTVILGYAEELSRQTDGNAAAKIVVEQAERCRGIVRSLSALAGQSIHPRRDMIVTELVDRVVRGLASPLERLNTSVRVDVAPGLHVHADRVGLEQVLTNLVVNALHVSPSNGTVTIAAVSTSRGIELTVTDQGPGVAPEMRERLFEPFFTTKAPGRGTGLGLSIAHAIVRGHGGELMIEDGPHGRGACFRVVIPPATEFGRAAVHDPPSNAGGQKLLIIDDDEAVRTVVRRHAERRGWSVSESESAEHALSNRGLLSEFDAVLCDLRMPGIGGVGFHDCVVADAPKLLERVVFVSGDLASPEVIEFSERCRRPLVQKPFEFTALFRVLERSAQRETVSS